MTSPCEHFEPEMRIEHPLDVCAACVTVGGAWVNLRQCLTCGQTSCCNDSPDRHAAAHHQETGHPMMRTAESGQDWLWCYVDELSYVPSPTGYVVAND